MAHGVSHPARTLRSWPLAMRADDNKDGFECTQSNIGKWHSAKWCIFGAIIVPLYIEATERAGFDWTFPFLSIGLVGLLWVPIWFFTVSMTGIRSLHPGDAREQEEALPPGDLEQSNSHHDRQSLYRKLITLFVIVATLTISWQFLRAWLALFLQDHLKYSKEATRVLMSGYYIAADVGCIASGLLIKGLMLRQWSLHHARQIGFFIFAVLTACGALVPFTEGSLMVGLLYVTGRAF